MIKLVVSDIDGTLLPEGTDRINPEIYDIIRELKKKGITFAAASGRQYMSMRYLFEPVADDIFFIAENGTIIMKDGKQIFSDFIEPGLAVRLLEKMRTYPGCEALLSVPEQLYMEIDNPKITAMLGESYHNRLDIVPDLRPYCEHTNKLTIHVEKDVEAVGAELKTMFGGELNVAVAGSIWVDCMSKNADKRTALQRVQQILGVSPEETMAFGDNCNDIGMLQQAGESYAVENARPELKKYAKYETGSYNKNGVLRTIRRRLL